MLLNVEDAVHVYKMISPVKMDASEVVSAKETSQLLLENFEGDIWYASLKEFLLNNLNITS